MSDEKPQIFKRGGSWYLSRPRLLGFVSEDSAWEVFGPFQGPSGAYSELVERFSRFGSVVGSHTLTERFKATNYWGEGERWKDT